MTVRRLTGCHQSRANQGCQIITYPPVVFLHDKGIERSVLGIVSEDVAKYLREDALSIGTVAVKEEHSLDAGIPAERIACGPCEKVNHFSVAVHYFFHESVPRGAVS